MHGCGQATFCFKCLEGLSRCPTCEEEIVGWNRVGLVDVIKPTRLKFSSFGMLKHALDEPSISL